MANRSSDQHTQPTPASILVCDPIAPEGIRLLAEHARVEVRTGLKPGELAGAVADYDGLVVRSQTRVTTEVIAAAHRLRVVGRAGVGVDNIDVEAATRKGVVVVNAPTAVNVAAAEHTLAMLFALVRNIPQADASLRAGRWDRGRFVGAELRGKTLGVVGLGNIGAELARRAAALEMRVLAADPFVSEEYARRLGAQLVSFEALIREADVVSVHVPLTPATRGLIGERELAMAKPGVRIVNCARGGIVDERALLAGLESGRVAGAALDVFSQEPPAGNPLVGHPKVVVTPHLGASTEEAQVSAAVEVAEQVVAVLQGQPARYAVNVPAMRPEALAALAPYIRLAETLGHLLAQLDGGAIGRLEIDYSGEIAGLDTTPLKAAAILGLLREASPERVNLVNALLVARNRGLHVAERKTDEPADNYANLITLRADGASRLARAVAGTVINGEPHVVGIDDYRVDVVPGGGYLLFCHHTDRPGVIGRIGTLLGDHDINISFMQVGRRQPRGEAMMVLGLDERISEDDELYRRILEAGDIQTARLVRL
jgi:D-3-phosphoglycerate dehydrogenase